MQIKIHLPGMAVVASMLLLLASSCASSSQQLEQPRYKPYEERGGNAR